MSNTRDKASQNRRQFLKLGVMGAAAAVPLVITLTPRQARARGSWMGGGADPNDPYGGAMMNEPLYGSWEWRQRKLQHAQEQHAIRARYGGFGGE